MSEKKESIPKIRFPGFTGAWEQRKLGEVADIVGGGTPSTSIPEYWGGEIDWYSPMEIGQNVYAERSVKRITELGLQKSSAKVHPPNKTILFTSRAGIGDMAILKHPAATNQGFQSLVIRNNNDVYFVYSMGHLIKRYALKNASGSTFLEISGKVLGNMDVLMPCEVEQQKIGQFFSNLDNLITLHQRKLKNVQSLKAGLLQKMFPKDGESLPEVRFPGFTNPWEQRKFGEVAEFSKGSGYTKDDLTESGSPIILYGRLYTKYETVINDVDTFVKMKEKAVISQGNEVIIPSSGETAEDISRASVIGKPGFILGGDLNIIKPKKEIDPIFLALTISNGTQQKEISKRAQGKSIVHLHNSDLKQVNLLYPKLDEQKQIGELFLKFDNLMTLHQRKIKHLQEQKKALLQQMFV